MAKAQLAQLLLHGLEVLVVQLGGKDPEELHEAFGVKGARVAVGDLPESLEHHHEDLEHLDGAVQDRVGGLAGDAEVDLPLGVDCLHGDVVHLPYDGGVLQGIAQDLLAVGDRPRVVEARQDGRSGDVEEELVAERHGREQRVELQVLRQIVCAGGELVLEVEVPVAVHEEGLHEPMRCFRRS